MKNLHKIQLEKIPQEVITVAKNWQIGARHDNNRRLRYNPNTETLYYLNGYVSWRIFPKEHYKFWNRPSRGTSFPYNIELVYEELA